MNRTIALFLALAILLAHALALHQAANGDVAPPYDQAHVAYRLGRNLAQTGTISWEPGGTYAEGHPSLLLIGLASIVESMYLSVTTSCQTLGVIAVVLTFIVASFFSPVRLAGVIAPLLLVVSGGLAASSLGGTEIPFATLAATTGFLAFERRRPVLLAVSLVLLAVVRAEGVVLVLAFLACELSGPRIARPAGRRLLGAFVPALATIGTIAVLRSSAIGTPLSPAMSKLLAADELERGWRFVQDFAIGSVTPFLAAFPLWYLARRVLPPTGVRALLFAATWTLGVALSGGGSMPFAAEMVPVLPMLFVSVQEAMQVALDSKRNGLPQLSWALFLLGMVGSGLASKFPGDLGPIPTGDLHRRWLESRAEPWFGYEGGLSRLALSRELRATERLRATGLFLRDQVDPDSTILTAWPGAIGYLSNLRVVDLLGRTAPSPGRARVRAWTGRPRTDVLAVLALEPDYILPSLATFRSTPHINVIAQTWLEGLDVDPNTDRQRELVQALQRYEMLAVPLYHEGQAPTADAAMLYLLRHRDLGLAPVISIDVGADHFTIEARHRSHGQIVDLRVQFEDVEGRTWTLRPTGELDESDKVLARTRLYLPDTGNRTIRLVHAPLPREIQPVRLRAVLRNPGSRHEDSFAGASSAVSVDL